MRLTRLYADTIYLSRTFFRSLCLSCDNVTLSTIVRKCHPPHGLNICMDRRIVLSQKKLNQAHVLARLVSDENFTIKQAAEAMGLSERQVKRLKGEFKNHGARER